MKRNKIIFWITTGLISIMMVFSAMNYFMNEEVKEGFVHLGFPSYFRVELGIAKLIGAIVLILPMVSSRIREFAYAGFAITFISAFIAHLSAGDPITVALSPLIFLVVLSISYTYSGKMSNVKTKRSVEQELAAN